MEQIKGEISILNLLDFPTPAVGYRDYELERDVCGCCGTYFVVEPDELAYIKEVVSDLYEACKTILLKSYKSMLEDCAYQGIPPKKWVKETAPYYDGYNKCLGEIKVLITEALAKAEGK